MIESVVGTPVMIFGGGSELVVSICDQDAANAAVHCGGVVTGVAGKDDGQRVDGLLR